MTREFSRDPRVSGTLEPRAYFEPRFFEEEREAIFARSWKYAGHRSELSRAGAFVTVEVAGESVILIRGEDGAARAFYNVCQHRAHPLLQGAGEVGQIQCPYHAWTYALDGRLKHAPHAGGSVDRSCFALEPIRVEELCGFYFINLDAGAAPLHSVASGLEAEIRRYAPEVEQLEKVEEWSEVRQSNWKLVIENDVECYHCPPAHRALTRRLNLAHYRSTDHGVYTTHIIPAEADRQQAAPGRDAFLYWYLWPDTEARVMPGPPNFAWYTMEPLGPATTRLRYHHFLLTGASGVTAEGVRHDPESDPTVAEDVRLVESVQRGLRSRGYRRGTFVIDYHSSNTEHSVHHFQTMVAGAMGLPVDPDEVDVYVQIVGRKDAVKLRARPLSPAALAVATPAPFAVGTHLLLRVGSKVERGRVERLITATEPVGELTFGMMISISGEE